MRGKETDFARGRVMTTRREDELDLEAMRIADAVKLSDNLRLPPNPESLLRWMQDRLTPEAPAPIGHGYHAVSAKGSSDKNKVRNQQIRDFVAAGNTQTEAGKFFGLSQERVSQIVRGVL